MYKKEKCALKNNKKGTASHGVSGKVKISRAGLLNNKTNCNEIKSNQKFINSLKNLEKHSYCEIFKDNPIKINLI